MASHAGRRVSSPLLLIIAATSIVAPTAAPQLSLQARLDRAAAGDTITVPTGTYRECPVIERPVVLIAEGDVTVGTACAGNVFTVRASATIRRFHIVGSGKTLAREDSGIWAEDVDSLLIEDNVLEDVLFGIYIKNGSHPVIRGNTVRGWDLPITNRGDGIRLWYSRGGLIENNDVTHARDVVIWFSDSAVVRHNRVADGRYGLHYMYSNHSTFEDNAFLDNEVGGFLMYSSGITFRRNVFARARGLFGKGLGFKDAEDITARDNTIVKNAIGVYLDNSPNSIGHTNTFAGNTFAFNDVGVSLLPSVHGNMFASNDFLDNVEVVRVRGGGTATDNTWQDNFWTDYAGFDANHDGAGDTPFISDRVSGDLFTRYEALQLFTLSPAATALEFLGRVAPTLKPTPVLVDSTPRRRRHPAAPRDTPEPNLPGAAIFILLAGGAAAVVRRHR